MFNFSSLFKSSWFLATLVFISYFIIAFLTLPNYGISWDEPTHFKRGQGYLWFLITGDNDYSKLQKYDLYKAQTDPQYHKRSLYQDDKHNAAFYRTIDGTHPPFADILSSVTNIVFYQKLGIMGDIESYHLFEILAASVGVAVLFLFVYEGFGFIAACFSTLMFATFPLFWGESHFNIKDPVETSWIIVTLYFLWRGIKNKSPISIILSAVFAGFALSTKLNVIFLPFIVLPWIFYIFTRHKKDLLPFIKSKYFFTSVTLYPVIILVIFYISYPFLWENTFSGIVKVLTYYKNNALDPAFANAVLPSWNFYAIRWIVLTAPPALFLGLLLNFIYLKHAINKQYSLVLLALLWLIVTIGRVSIPGINIYGGVRQIMEYIPALSILSGIGFAWFLSKLPKNITVLVFLIVALVSVYPLVKLHPNENVYFNFISGGLEGAVEAGVPAAGNSFGNAYYQGVLWINKNSEKEAKLALLQGSAINVPKNKLRSDIDLINSHFSGINREGEYLMELTHNWEHRQNFYAWEYVDTFLEPVYEVKADGATLLKVWKNDLEHTKTQYKKDESIHKDFIISKQDNILTLDLKREVNLSRLSLSYDQTNGCTQPVLAGIETSKNGNSWIKEKDPLSFKQVGEVVPTFRPAWDTARVQVEVKPVDSITFYFSGRNASYLRLVLDDANSCLLNNPIVEIKALVLGI